MTFTVHHYHHSADSKLEHLLQRLLVQGDQMAATMKEVVDKLNTLTTQLGKVDAEIQTLKQKVVDLQTTIDNGPPVTPELQAAVDAVAAAVQKADDQMPDQLPPPVPPVP